MAELNTIERDLLIPAKQIKKGDWVVLGDDGHIVAGTDAAYVDSRGLVEIRAADGRKEIVFFEGEDPMRVIRDEIDVRPATVVAVLKKITALEIEPGPIVRLKDGWYDQDGDKIADPEQDLLIDAMLTVGNATIAYEPEA